MSSVDRNKIPSSDSTVIDISGGRNVEQSVTEYSPTEQLFMVSESPSTSNLIPSFLSLGQCMFPSSSASVSQSSATDDEEIQFIRETATPGPGRSSNDPIVISDSPTNEEEPTSTSNLDDQMDGQGMLHVDVVGSQYSGGPYHLQHLETADGATQASHVYTLRHLPPHLSLPHLSYQIRLSIPQPMAVRRPTPVYRPIALHPPPSTPLLHEFYSPRFQSAAHDMSGYFGTGSGASQRLIEDCTVKTRFIKRMPSKNKAVNAKRQPPKCPICLEEFVDKVKIRRLRCIHNFHIKCIDQWLKKNMICPVCRKSILAR